MQSNRVLNVFVFMLAMSVLNLSAIDNENIKVLSVVKKYIPDEPVILEAGGHFGEDTQGMKSVWPKAVMHVFEPLSSSYEVLPKETKSFVDATCYPYAPTFFIGMTNFYIDIPNRGVLPIDFPVESNQNEFNKTPIKVPCVTINSCADRKNVSYTDFMSLDMEGHELNALRNASNILKAVSSIYTEISFVPIREHSCVILEERDIQAIYDNYVKTYNTYEYKSRYVPLPVNKNNLPWRWENKDFPRVIALLEFERFVNEYPIICKKGLAINGLYPEGYYMKTKQITQIDYEINHDKYDLHKIDLAEKDFDFVIVNQTLEHLYDPIRCLQNIYQHMKVGGILYFNVPAFNILHSTPFHYYMGFTPVGLGAMAVVAGFKILSIGQWGNLEYIKKMLESYSWPDYRQFNNPGFNDLDYPVITWIFCEKVE